MLATQNDAEVLLGNTLEESKMSKSSEELAQEYVIGEFPDTNSDMFLAAESVHKAFIAGYKAAQDQVLARFKSLLSSFAETSFNPNHTAWQIFDTLNENQAAQDQFADADKVMCSTTMEEIRAVDTGELMPITNLNQMHWPQKRISVEEAREMFPDKPPKEEK